VKGQNIAIERRYASGQIGRLAEVAADLVRLPVDLIVAQSFPAALAAKQATTTIPLVVMGPAIRWLPDSLLALLGQVGTLRA
jgi:putative ABC transport system substrate-binding protein